MPGAAQCVANLMIIKSRLDAASKKAVEKWAKDTMKESKDRYCPVDKGVLKASGKHEVIKNTLTEFYVRLSYNTPYAIFVHEIPYYRHPKGQWKYLSTPFNARSQLLIKEVEAAWSFAL
jgi:hypothetical protein